MTITIFQFDWIFIDTIVIILLIVFLVSVKIFKERFRWRSTLSNIALDQFVFDGQSFDPPPNQSIIIKKCCITINNVLKNNAKVKPSIIIIRTNMNKTLFNVLTEGLASYGFNVINLVLNIKPSHNHRSLEKYLQEDSTHLISTILNSLKQRKLIANFSYIIIMPHKLKLSYNSIVYDKNNTGMILINPKFDITARNKISEIIEKKELLSKLFIIFSKKSSKILTNKNLKEFLTHFADYSYLSSNICILDKSKTSFKSYETILLGIIINVVESDILKSQILS